MSRFACTAQDVPAMVEFLERHVDTSLFLLENLHRGLGEGGPTYAIARDEARDDGSVRGVASVNPAGVLLLQAPADTAALAAVAIRKSGLAVCGILGPTEQVSAVLEGLELHRAPARMHSDERLYELDLRTFSAAAPSPDTSIRLATDADVDVLTTFSRAYLVEALGAVDDTGLDARARGEGERRSRDGVTFVLVEHGALVAMTSFTARHGGVVQVGGVFTPPSTRRRGHGRAVVAGSLVHARRTWGADRAVLFTAESNTPAQRAYEALGFTRKGGYSLHFFRDAIRLPAQAP